MLSRTSRRSAMMNDSGPNDQPSHDPERARQVRCIATQRRPRDTGTRSVSSQHQRGGHPLISADRKEQGQNTDGQRSATTPGVPDFSSMRVNAGRRFRFALAVDTPNGVAFVDGRSRWEMRRSAIPGRQPAHQVGARCRGAAGPSSANDAGPALAEAFSVGMPPRKAIATA